MEPRWRKSERYHPTEQEWEKITNNKGRASNVDYGAKMINEMVKLTFLMLSPFILLLSLFGVTLHLTDRSSD